MMYFKNMDVFIRFWNCCNSEIYLMQQQCKTLTQSSCWQNIIFDYSCSVSGSKGGPGARYLTSIVCDSFHHIASRGIIFLRKMLTVTAIFLPHSGCSCLTSISKDPIIVSLLQGLISKNISKKIGKLLLEAYHLCLKG